MSSYVIADEPRPSGLSNLAVNPLWPLLAVMFAGPWLSWVWFGVNGFALGCPARRKTAMISAAAFIGNAILMVGVIILLATDALPDGSIPYAFIVITVWKLGISYWLHILQTRTFHLFEYYGGATRNGIPVFIIGYFLRGRLISLMPDSIVGIFLVGVLF